MQLLKTIECYRMQLLKTVGMLQNTTFEMLQNATFENYRNVSEIHQKQCCGFRRIHDGFRGVRGGGGEEELRVLLLPYQTRLSYG